MDQGVGVEIKKPNKTEESNQSRGIVTGQSLGIKGQDREEVSQLEFTPGSVLRTIRCMASKITMLLSSVCFI
jgi:hypothetical protein